MPTQDEALAALDAALTAAGIRPANVQAPNDTFTWITRPGCFVLVRPDYTATPENPRIFVCWKVDFEDLRIDGTVNAYGTAEQQAAMVADLLKLALRGEKKS